jgi:putative sterol carrier protein
MKSMQQFFDLMPGSFQKDAAKGLTATFQFDLAGEGGGQWYASVKEGELTVASGRHPAPEVTISATASDYAAIAEGRMNQMLAFTMGKLKVSGKLGLAMKLPKIFKR